MAASDEQDTRSTHISEVDLRWSDFDRFGHVNNAAFIEIAQEARLAFAEDQFRERGYEIPAVFVRHLEVDYLRAILPDTTKVVVETLVTRLGNTSFTTRQEVKDRTGRVCCVVECVQVTVDLQTATPRAISKVERKVLSRVAESSIRDNDVLDS
ncbi:acyl-CoA thioesterase [Corynebacterium pacaense]|uniref:acyl-CoA thioesterase n=1 Tax=Corynebacterium pacaense TaxID=1816684 RepID=UPI0009BBC25B